jgi:beta-lactamase regulating signal transducer with metallopeptidase domain
MMLNQLLNFLSNQSLPLLADATIKTSLILILACVLDRMLARSTAALRHRVWALSLSSALLIPTLSIALPQWQIPILPDLGWYPGSSRSSEITTTSTDSDSPNRPRITDLSITSPTPFDPENFQNAIPSSDDPSFDNIQRLHEANSNLVATSPNISAESTQQSRSRFYFAWLPIVWAVGCFWKLVPIVSGLNANRRLIRKSIRVLDPNEQDSIASLAKRLGLRRRVSLFQAESSVVPMTLGIFRPAIVVPNSWRTWTCEQRECVMLHELAHIKRFDVAYQLVGCFAAAIHWFNPLVWLALRQLRIERELACDDCVLEAGELPSEYAKQLVVVARAYQPSRPTVSVAMASSARLDDRIRAILDTARSRLPLSHPTAITLSIAALTLFSTVAVIRPVERSVHADESPKPKIAKTDQSNDDKRMAAENLIDQGKASGDTAINDRSSSDFSLVFDGRVELPNGNAGQNAKVFLLNQYSNRSYSYDVEMIAPRAFADGDGRFRFEMRYEDYQSSTSPARTVPMLAVSMEGYGISWAPAVGFEGSGELIRQLETSNGFSKETKRSILDDSSINKLPISKSAGVR